MLAAGVYKWVDAKGVVHYDDTTLFSPQLTQADIDRRVIKARPMVPTPPEYRAQVRQLCILTSERLVNYRDARELYGQDPFGDIYLMSPRQVGLTIAETERDQGRYCGSDAADKLFAQQLAELRKAKMPADDSSQR